MADTIFWTVSRDDQTPCLDLTIPFNAYLTPSELERLSQLRFPKRRAEWLQGRWTSKYLLRHSPNAYSHFSNLDIQIKNEAEGMPYFEIEATGARLPVGISISHRDHLAFCALSPSPDIKVGADLELVENRPPSFLQDFFTEREYTNGLLLTGPQRDLWFTLLWSLKEAVLKAVGKGLRLDTRSVEILSIEDLTGALQDSAWRKAEISFKFNETVQWDFWWSYRKPFIYSIAASRPQSHQSVSPQLVEVAPCLPEMG